MYSMSDIDSLYQQTSETQVIVDQKEFNTEIQKYYSGHNENSKKLEWTSQRIKSVMTLLDEYNTTKSQGKRPSNKQYHHARKYDVMDSGYQKVLIVKRKDILDPVVQIIPTEDYYQILMDTHLATGHGRRDKMVQALKDKFVVPIFAISIFLNLCTVCLSKKSSPKKAVVVKQLIPDDFNKRGHINLIDFRTSPDKDYKWLLQYQDHLTKFSFLRPLKSKQAKEVAIEIVKIFLEFGCPNILQSHHGREFTASVIKEIVSLWPACKIVNGRPRHPQSQGSIERSNLDVKNIIRAWMTDNKSTNWSIGCYFAQFEKNSSYHSTITRAPYKALFGEDPKLGLSSTNLPENIISKLETEEDMERFYEELNNNKERNLEKDQEEEDHGNVYSINIPLIDIQTIKQEETNSPEPFPHTNEPDNEQEKTSLDNENTIKSEVNIAKQKQDKLRENINKDITALKKDIASNHSNVLSNVGDIGIKIEEINYLVCNICNKESSEDHICSKCMKIVHAMCGVLCEESDGYGSQLLCNLCVNERNIEQGRTQSHINLKRVADKTIATSPKKFKDTSICSTVLVEVPKDDRGPLNNKKLIGKNELYQIGTAFNVLSPLLSQNAELLSSIPEGTLQLSSIASMSSSFGGQVITQCNCKKMKNRFQCVSKKCSCKKANIPCNSRCHSSLACNNDGV